MPFSDKKKVFCTGLICCDVPLKPIPADMLEINNAAIETPVLIPGGDATNVAISISRLGMQSCLTGLVGEDFYGTFVLDYLKKEGVDIRAVQRHKVYGTSVSYILIDTAGERHFLTYSPINGELCIDHIREDLLKECDLVYIGSSMSVKGLDHGGSAELFKKAHSMGKITASDFDGDGVPGYWLKELDSMLGETDILLPSLREATALTGKKELNEIRDALSVYHPKILAVKLGRQGCYVTDFKNEWNIPSFDEFSPVDTTGAGDSFGAGFVRAYLSGWDTEACGLFACAVAGFNVTKVGATGGVPSFEIVYNFITERFGKERFPIGAG